MTAGPLRGKAVVLSGGITPAVTTACVGCGVCEYVCPVKAVEVPARIRAGRAAHGRADAQGSRRRRMTSSPAIYVGIRRCAQTLTALVFCLLPWLNAPGAHQFTLISGSLFALDLGGLPFADPVAALQVAVGVRARAPPVAGGRVVLGPGVFAGPGILQLDLPLRLLSELVSSLRRRAAGVSGGHKESDSRQRDRRDAAFRGRAGIVLLGLVGAAVLGFPLLSLLSMPGELSLAPLLARQEAGRADGLILLSALALPVAALALEALGGRRFWCRYVCPQSVLLGLAARCLPQGAPGLRMTWRASACTCKGETPCRAACSLALNPRRAAGPPRRDCVMCGDCLKACAARGGALRWSLRAAFRRGSKDGGGDGG